MAILPNTKGNHSNLTDYTQYFVGTLLFSSIIMLFMILFSSQSRILYLTGYTIFIISISFLTIGTWNGLKFNTTNTSAWLDAMPFLLTMITLALSIYLFSSYTDVILSNHVAPEYYIYSKISTFIFILQACFVFYWLLYYVKITTRLNSNTKIWSILPSNHFIFSMVAIGVVNMILVLLMYVKLTTSLTGG